MSQEKPNLSAVFIWLGIEYVVKTFDRGEDEKYEKIDVEEVNKLLDESDAVELSE